MKHSIKDEQCICIIRGATLDSQQCKSRCCALGRILSYPRQLTYAHTSQNTLWQATFDCALSGPFDNLFLAWLPASQALCGGIIAVISASTVCFMKLK